MLTGKIVMFKLGALALSSGSTFMHLLLLLFYSRPKVE